MNILKIYPTKDTESRYNYDINYGVWDSIAGDRDTIEGFHSDFNEYDIVFLPQIKRWYGNESLLNKIKSHKIKKVLFDNDSYRRSFSDNIYAGFDYIFYRDLDRNKRKPLIPSSLLKWSVNTVRFTPVYGGSGIEFMCSIVDYPLRKQVAQFVNHSKVSGDNYVKRLQAAGAAIHVDHPKVGAVAAKVLEFAACGTQIISNRTKNMDLYFPDELIIYFENTTHLKQIIKDFKPDIKVQEQLYDIAYVNHNHVSRAIEILNKIQSI
jgi:hypothetical protein